MIIVKTGKWSAKYLANSSDFKDIESVLLFQSGTPAMLCGWAKQGSPDLAEILQVQGVAGLVALK